MRRRPVKPCSLLERLDETPPFLCYYLARDSKAPLSHPTPEKIAERGGLSVRTVVRLASTLTWEHLPLRTIDAFCKGCRVSFVHLSADVRGFRRYFLIRPFSDYLWRLANGYCENPMNHLLPKQKKKLVALGKKWDELKARRAKEQEQQSTDETPQQCEPAKTT